MRLHKFASLPAAALILTAACAGQPPIPEAGSAGLAEPLVLTYEDVRGPLTVIHDTSTPTAGMRVTPSKPSKRFADDETSFWIGMTDAAMVRCGYVKRAQALRARFGGSEAYRYGSLKLKGEVMASCLKALRLADRVLAS